MKYLKKFNESNDTKTYVIDKDTKEYLGTFDNLEDAKSAMKDSYKPDEQEIVTGIDSDFEVSKDEMGFYKKFYKKYI